jgi:hypothetical protein
LPRFDIRSRQTRHGGTAIASEFTVSKQLGMSFTMELPPGGTFEPDPNTGATAYGIRLSTKLSAVHHLGLGDVAQRCLDLA